MFVYVCTYMHTYVGGLLVRVTWFRMGRSGIGENCKTFNCQGGSTNFQCFLFVLTQGKESIHACLTAFSCRYINPYPDYTCTHMHTYVHTYVTQLGKCINCGVCVNKQKHLMRRHAIQVCANFLCLSSTKE